MCKGEEMEGWGRVRKETTRLETSSFFTGRCRGNRPGNSVTTVHYLCSHATGHESGPSFQLIEVWTRDL